MKALLNFIYDNNENVCVALLSATAFIGGGCLLFASFQLIGRYA